MSDFTKQTIHQQENHQQQTLDLSIALLERPSVTPDDDGCQDILSKRLSQAGFDCEFMYFGDRDQSGEHAEVKNLWARVVPLIQLSVLLVIPTSCQQVMKTIGRIRHLRQPSLMVTYGLAVRLT